MRVILIQQEVNMLYYYTIQPHEDADQFMIRIYIDFPYADLVADIPPTPLMGNAKVLTLHTKGTHFHIKIDGPGFIVDKIYKEVMLRGWEKYNEIKRKNWD